MLLRRLSVVSFLAASAICQQSLALSLASPTQLSASLLGVSQTTPLVAGPLANTGVASALAQSLGDCGVELAWHANAAAVGMTVDLSLHFSSSGQQVGQATALPIEFLLQVDTPSGDLRLELSSFLGGVVSANVPLLRIDVDDDGSVELAETMPVGFVQANRTVGAAPLAIRCTLGGQLTGPGTLDARLRLRILPGSTSAGIAVNGCMPGYDVAPRFDGGIDCTFQPPGLEVGVAVFGLSPAPMLLGSVGILPCLLWPSVDLFVVAPAWQTLTLPIPASARPLGIYTQAVYVDNFPSLKTSPGWLVQAF